MFNSTAIIAASGKLRRFGIYLLLLVAVSMSGGCISGSLLYSPKITEKGKVRLTIQPNVMPVVMGTGNSNSNTSTNKSGLTSERGSSGVGEAPRGELSTHSTPPEGGSSGVGEAPRGELSTHSPTIKGQPPGAPLTLPLPILDVALAVGVTDWMEIQFGANYFGVLSIGTAFQLIERKEINVAGVLEVQGLLLGLTLFQGWGFVAIPINILIGINFTENFSLNLGIGYKPFIAYGGIFIGGGGASASVVIHFLTPSAALEYRISKNFGMRFQVALDLPVPDARYFFKWNVGLGFLVNI